MSDGDAAELPEGWAWTKLGELGTWFGGGTPTTSVSEFWDGGTIPWISAKDMKADCLGTAQDSITETGRAAARLTLLPPGSVLMVVRGMILARAFPVAVTTAPATINQDLRALVPSPVVEPMFLLRSLQLVASEVVQATGEATHGTRRLESDLLKSWPMPVPPLAEQGRIVAAVERVLEKASSARERLERVPTTLKRFRQAVLAAACSGRLTADWREVNDAGVSPALPSYDPSSSSDDVPELPEFPEHWSTTSVGDCSELVQYGTSEKADPSGRVPLLRMGNIQDGRIILDDLKYVHDTLPGLANLLLKPGDLLFNRTNSPELVGKSGVVESDERATFASYLIRVRCKSGILDSRLLCWWLNSPWGREWAAKVRTDGVSQSNINGTKLQNTPIGVPPLTEQEEIIRRASALLALADSIELRAKTALRRVELLTQSVLAKAFRGELVPTEAELARRDGRSYETASELLARLRASLDGESKRKRTRGKKLSPKSSALEDGMLDFMEG